MVKSFDRGPISGDERRPRYNSKGIRLINGRQVNLILAKGRELGMSEQKLLEFIEFECGINVTKLEDIRDGAPMQTIIAKLKERM